MALVDPKLLEGLNLELPAIKEPSTQPLSIKDQTKQELNTTLHDTLNHPTLPRSDRIKLYHQTLDHYNAHHEVPPPLDVVKEDPVEVDIIESVPKLLTKKAKRLMGHIKKSDSLSWNDRGELIHAGERMPHTNISDLVNDLLRKRKHFEPRGWRTFADVLHETNVPTDLVGNQDRLRYMQRQYTKSEEDVSDHSVYWDPL